MTTHLAADECVREDYDVAQRVARERAAHRGVRQFVARRWKSRTVPVGAAGGYRWVVCDAPQAVEMVDRLPRGIVTAVPAPPPGPPILSAELLESARDAVLARTWGYDARHVAIARSEYAA